MNSFLEWLREITNRPKRKIPPEALPFDVVFDASGGGEDRLSILEHPAFTSPRSEAPALLIVLTTCQRVGSARAVLQGLARTVSHSRSRGLGEVVLLVMEDRAEVDYSAARRETTELFPGEMIWVQSARRMGKQGYWATYQAAFLAAEAMQAHQVFFIQDDLDFRDSVLEDARALLAAAQADGKQEDLLVVNLFADVDDEENGRWIRFSRRPLSGIPLRQTQWFDLQGYLIQRGALASLRYRVIPISKRRWKKKPNRSSGVGRQLTRRLFRRARIYQCDPPLIFHGSEPSVMNPESRKERAMDNRWLRR